MMVLGPVYTSTTPLVLMILLIGYRPSNHKRTTSRDDGYNSSAGDEMSMWSPNYSFGQTSRNLSTHHEEDHGDPLLR